MVHKTRFTSEKIAKYLTLIAPLVYKNRMRLPDFRFIRLDNPSAPPPVGVYIDDSGWEKFPAHSNWGAARLDFALRTRFSVPRNWEADAPLALHLPIGEAGDFCHPESLGYIDGKPFASCDRFHQEIILPGSFYDREGHILALHGWTGSLARGRTKTLHMGEPALVQIHQPTRDFVALARVALGIADNLAVDNPAKAHLYTALNAAFNQLDTRHPLGSEFYQSVDRSYRILREGIDAAGPALDVSLTAAGHAHLDVAWLWTLAHTRRKAGCTFHNAVRLMEQFPEFHFTQSQAQLYDFVRQEYGQLFEPIQERVKEGRWEIIGGMWVEPDCNLSSGEALARQFLLGDQFFRAHFGENGASPVLWLPDVFGFPWSLPQLAKEAGMNYFFTIKLGWSQYNRMPYDSFYWQGIDGTRLLTHFSSTKEKGSTFVSAYNAKATPYEAMSTWRNFQQKDWGVPGKVPPLLMVYGHGDGGGGPTREMLENITVMGDFPATPRVIPGRVDRFFQTLESTMRDRLPVWNGELYLEYHRGTYTTQARNKRLNRKSEFALHDAEFLAAYASTVDRAYAYPHDSLGRAWELVCLNQFHDILPGTSIGEVYEESVRQYEEVFEICQQAGDEALSVVNQHLGGDLLVINPTPYERHDPAFFLGELPPGAALEPADGTRVSTQRIEGGLLLDVGGLPPYSVTPLKIVTESTGQHPSPARSGVLNVSERYLENEHLLVEFNDSGDITRIYDKRFQREVLPDGVIANQFQAFEDRPKTPDAWEIDIYYDDRMWLAEPAEYIRGIERGPLRATIEIQHQILNSRIVQRISLAHNSSRLDFDTRIDWRERHILLKAAFPVEILSPYATYDIPWGSIQRPTHRNTSWDMAKFEVPAQKWIDISEGGYGVSLLNDCKYGFDVHENVMRISLLRGSTYPDPQADLGVHNFVYSLYPHGGSELQETISAAYALNDPIRVWQAQKPTAITGKSADSFLRTDRPNVVIETVKAAEDGRGLIVRLYENMGWRGKFRLTSGFRLAGAWHTDLIEHNQTELEAGDDEIVLPIKPYQIMTLRLNPV